MTKKIVPLIKCKFKGLPIKEQGEFAEGDCTIEISPEYRAWLRYYDEGRLVGRQDSGIPSNFRKEFMVPFSVFNAMQNQMGDASASVYVLQKQFRDELKVEFQTSLNVFERIKAVVPKIGEYIYNKVKLAKYSDQFEIKMELDIKTDEGITGEVEIIGERGSSTSDKHLREQQSRIARLYEPEDEDDEDEHHDDDDERDYEDEA